MRETHPTESTKVLTLAQVLAGRGPPLRVQVWSLNLMPEIQQLMGIPQSKTARGALAGCNLTWNCFTKSCVFLSGA